MAKIVQGPEFRELAKAEILYACDFRKRTAGRPRVNKLGTTSAVQMTTTLAAKIIDVLVDEIEAEGKVLCVALEQLYTPKGRRTYARDLLLRMAQGNRAYVSDVPEEQFLARLGEVVAVGKRRPFEESKTLGKPARLEMHYVGTAGSDNIQLDAAWAVIRLRKAAADKRFHDQTDDYANIVPRMPPGVCLEDHAAEAVKRYHEQHKAAELRARKKQGKA